MIARSRPEAQRLIGEVDGLVTLGSRADDARVAGATRAVRVDSGYGFHIAVNSGRLDGELASDRDLVVLHWLGHVIDHAVVPPALDAQLNAGQGRPARPQRQPGWRLRAAQRADRRHLRQVGAFRRGIPPRRLPSPHADFARGMGAHRSAP